MDEPVFVAVRKPIERTRARGLRRDGMPLKRIAAELGVSVSTVHLWTRDVELTEEQCRRNLRGPGGPRSPEAVAKFVSTWRAKNRERRRAWQEEGRRRARLGESLHQAGCMLYWAEGAKRRNSLVFTNSDQAMVVYFCRFLRKCFGLGPDDMTIRLNVYTTNGLTIREIEDHWLWTLGLPRSCLRKHSLNHTPTSSSGKRPPKAALRRLHAAGQAQHADRSARLRRDPGICGIR
jgi:transposase